ncbi:YqjK-like protein [Polaromonas sp. OV174]|uniref:YqjK family protein n=1 Tax=Polaromonas sp. OV174 TaxID=1855300 RepID=UPI0008E11D39|nr:YqjK family protein [Polaromonas sp. OV174]SFC22380.1 YqjK-like protein [Polaromonas sp. OV174]
MSKSLTELHQQRGRLLERIAYQRAELRLQLQPLQNASDAGNRVFTLISAGLQYLKTHPLPLLLAGAALVLFKPRRAWRWFWRGVGIWRSWKVLRNWLSASGLSRWL